MARDSCAPIRKKTDRCTRRKIIQTSAKGDEEAKNLYAVCSNIRPNVDF
jgi:hypothetical protein